MATYTTNYNLDKYEGTDAPNLTDQYNSAMDKIDAQMMINAQSAQTAQTAAQNAATAASEASQSASNAAQIASGAQEAATAATSEAQSAAEKAQTALTTAQAAAPASHASPNAIYGLGSSTNYGHVKLYSSTAGNNSDGAPTVAAVLAAITSTVRNGDIVTSGQINLANADLGDWFSIDSVGERALNIRYNKALNLYNLYLRCQGNIKSSSQNQYLVGAGTIPANLRPSSDRTISGALTIIGADATKLTSYDTEDIILTADGGIKLPVSIGAADKYVVLAVGQLTLFANDWGVTG